MFYWNKFIATKHYCNDNNKNVFSCNDYCYCLLMDSLGLYMYKPINNLYSLELSTSASYYICTSFNNFFLVGEEIKGKKDRPKPYIFALVHK